MNVDPLSYKLDCILYFTVKLENIVEVRCGHQTRNFNQFPYLEVKKQSFSLMFEREQGESLVLMFTHQCISLD